MKRLTKQQKAWREILATSTNPQEIIETAAKLDMDPVTMKEAEEIAELHKPQKLKNLSQLWEKLCDSESPAEMKAILKKIYPGISSEDLEMFLEELLSDD